MKQEIVKSSLTEIMSIGKAFAESGMFTDVKTAAQAIVKIQAGAEIGLPPFASMTGIHIISGKPTIGAGLIASSIKGSGKYDYRVKEQNEKVCSIDFYEVPRRVVIMESKNGGEEKIPGLQFIGNSTFTIEDARKAGTKNLDKFPKNMLFARAISNGVKWFCPDVFAGPVYVPEEMETVQTVEAEAEDVGMEVMAAIAKVNAATTTDELKALKSSLPAYIVSDASFIAAGKERYNVIMAAAPKAEPVTSN